MKQVYPIMLDDKRTDAPSRGHDLKQLEQVVAPLTCKMPPHGGMT